MGWNFKQFRPSQGSYFMANNNINGEKVSHGHMGLTNYVKFIFKE